MLGMTQQAIEVFGNHGYNGLLYRENETAVVINHDGELVVQLQKLFRVQVANQNKYFVSAEPFHMVGTSNGGGMLVQRQQKMRFSC